jgi:hypothetical protein
MLHHALAAAASPVTMAPRHPGHARANRTTIPAITKISASSAWAQTVTTASPPQIAQSIGSRWFVERESL